MGKGRDGKMGFRETASYIGEMSRRRRGGKELRSFCVAGEDRES